MSGGTRWVPAMQRALALAQDAAAHGDVPIGAVLLGPDGQVLAEAGNERELTGDPTEGALLVAAAQGGVDFGAARRRYARVAELPFDSERKRMTTVHRLPEGNGPADDLAGTWQAAAGGDHLLLDHFAQVRAVRQRIGIGRGQGLHAHRIRKAGAILRE